MYNVYIYIYRVWFSAFLMETYSYFMTLAQVNILFMFLASTDIKTTDNYNSKQYLPSYIQNTKKTFVFWRICHGRLIKFANFRYIHKYRINIIVFFLQYTYISKISYMYIELDFCDRFREQLKLRRRAQRACSQSRMCGVIAH